MTPIRSEECDFPNILLQIRDLPGEMGRRQAEQKRGLIATIRSAQTTRYLIDANIILGMIQNETPVPPEMATNVRWPHQETIYIEYDSAIRLEPAYPEDQTPEFLKGNIIIPGEITATIKTVGTRGTDLLIIQHIMDLERGTAINLFTGQIPDELKEKDIQRAQKFFTRLAAYANAFAPRMPT